MLTSFRPLTIDVPKVLLPLVNVPMLEYTLEFLSQNGVEEVFVFCVWHAEKVQEYINKSKWPSILSVRCIASTACLSAGDALRELDTMNIIRSDPFVLISGDVISNINLKEAIAFHKRKRKEDINNVMTLVLKEVQKTVGVKPLLDDLVVAMDRNSSQIVLFENSCKKSAVKVSLELMADHPKGLTFHTELLDCNVDICSPELMVQFSDNFDYQDIRKDFIRNEVGNWSLGKHIYGYKIQNEYAARVQDFRSYHSICRDIVNRWVYPLVPDAQLVPGSNFVHTKRYTYRESGVQVSRSAVVGEGVVLSRGTVVGDKSVLRRTNVGRDCHVGHNCSVTDSHLFENVVLGSDVKVDQAILCEDVRVGAKAVIPRGCVICRGVVIAPDTVLPEFTRVFRNLPDNQEDCDTGSVGVLGIDNTVYIWKPTPGSMDAGGLGEDDEEEDEGVLNGGSPVFPRSLAPADTLRMASIGCKEEESWKRSLWSQMPRPEESDSDFEDIDGDGEGYGGGGGGDNFTGDVEGASARDVLNFAQVVGDMVRSGHAEGHPASSLLMEIKGYKFAQNKTFADCISGMAPALLEIIWNQSVDPASATGAVKPATFIVKLKETMKAGGWGHSLFETMIQDSREEIEIIRALENVVLLPQYASLYSIFRFILQVFFDADVVTDDAILQWAALRESLEEDVQEDVAAGESSSSTTVVVGGVTCTVLDADRVKLFREPTVQAFVEWVQEEEESGSEESDDEEEDEKEEEGGESEGESDEENEN